MHQPRPDPTPWRPALPAPNRWHAIGGVAAHRWLHPMPSDDGPARRRMTGLHRQEPTA